METERGKRGHAERSGPVRLPLRWTLHVCLRRIFDDQEIALAAKSHQRFHRRGLAIEMHGQHRPGAAGDGRLGLFEVDQKRMLVGIDKHRRASGEDDRSDRRVERVRVRDDLVARLYADGPESGTSNASVPLLPSAQRTCRTPMKSAKRALQETRGLLRSGYSRRSAGSTSSRRPERRDRRRIARRSRNGAPSSALRLSNARHALFFAHATLRSNSPA